ncbi:MAG: transposase, partial [Gemmatimonadota bacterium]|nr:transposase [Gemmatimonadota bacterium]
MICSSVNRLFRMTPPRFALEESHYNWIRFQGSAQGAGRKWGLNPETRLVQALVWFQVYPTWEVLGYLFGVDESVARRSTRDVLSVLESLSTFVLELRSGRPWGRSLAQVIQAFPAVEILIDATEQRVRRPTGWEQQKPFYSGKKKTHTLKNQITVCAEDGRVLSVSASVPGSVHDLTLLCQSGLLDRL